MSDSDDPRRRASYEYGVLSLRSSRDADAHVIALTGDFELATASRVARELEIAAATDATTIVLDLSALAFMDSTGLQTVVCAYEGLGGRLRLIAGAPHVQRVFEICGFAHLLPFVERRPPAPEPLRVQSPPTPTVDHAILSAQVARAAVTRRAGQAALASAVRSLRSHDRHRHLRVVR